MKNILQRIENIAQNERITIGAIERVIGTSKGVLSRAVAKGTDIQAKWLQPLVENYPQYSTDWLLTGKGSMLREQNQQVAIKEQKDDAEDAPLIPLIQQEAAAGFGSENFSIAEQDIQDRYRVPDFNGIDFMLRVTGNSMYPKYSSGDVIAVRVLKESRFIQWNKPHLVATKEQGLMVKRLLPHEDGIQMVSDNPKYPPFVVQQDEIVSIAVIVGVIRLE